jgi:hypothetical protein
MITVKDPLTPAEAERLVHLVEECAEVQKIACKILRYGYKSYHPGLYMKTDNRRLLMDELADVMATLELMYANNDIEETIVRDIRDKIRKKESHMKHQQERDHGT